jgi:hypothetical protein
MKICNHEGCKYNCFSGGYCKFHQKDRTDRPVRNLLQRQKKPIRKISRKGKERREQKSKLSEKDKLFWAAIWEEREHVDFETNEPIFGEPLTLYFHHILLKSKYPQYRFKKWNIVLVSWDTHTKTHTNIDLVPRIKAYEKELQDKISRGELL